MLNWLNVGNIFSSQSTSSRKKLNIALLAEDQEEYTNKRIIEAGKKLGHTMRFLKLTDCYLHVAKDKPAIYYKGEEVRGLDAVIPRVDRDALTYYGVALIRQFETQGITVLNTARSIAQGRDKFRSMQILIRHGIPMPETWLAHNPEDLKDITEKMGPPPYVAKMLQGTEGKGVMLFEGKKSAIGAAETFMDLNVDLLMQEFIKEAGNKDLRCLVVGGEVVATMQRTAKEGDFRANVSLGGKAEVVKPTQEEVEISLKAARILDLNMAGVDLIRSNRGPLVLEVNVAPQIEGIEKATGVNVAAQIIKHSAEKTRTSY